MLSPSDLLELWEALASPSVTRNALALAAAALPEESRERLAELPLGVRDRAILGLRAAVLGEELEARSRCPRCSEELEMTLCARELLASREASQEKGDTGVAGEESPGHPRRPLKRASWLEPGEDEDSFGSSSCANTRLAASAAEPASAGASEKLETQPRPGDDTACFDASCVEKTFALERNGLSVRFRLPRSSDLLAVEGLAVEVARPELLRRSLVGLKRDGTEAHLGELAPEEVEALCEAVAEAALEADPWAELRFALECPACQHTWQELFDVTSFFAAEIGHAGRRLLGEVHILARGYGWREVDILAMSPHRRQFYLEMLDR